MEIWKNVSEIEGLEEFNNYEVSNMGRVRSLKGEVKILNLYDNGTGYRVVFLYSKGKRKKMRVHRLVAMAFIENANPNRIEVNHLNKDRADNSISNLEWCTHKENIDHKNNNK